MNYKQAFALSLIAPGIWGGNNSLAPGLYETGTHHLIYSWEQLLGDEVIEGGVVHVNAGVLTTNVEFSPIFGNIITGNGSSDTLAGDLLLPVDAGITEIGEYAFIQCVGLSAVTIPNGVIAISTGAFDRCENLKSIILPDSLTSLGSGVFSGCVNLESVGYIPVGVTEIPYATFADCTKLQEIKLHDTITMIGMEAFSGCSALTRVTIPANADVGAFAFYQCPYVQYYDVHSENPYVQSVDGNLYNKSGTTLHYYACGKTDKEFIVPDGVTNINVGAFWGCQNIETVTVASSVANIYRVAFGNCASLSVVIMKAETPPNWAGEAVFHETKLSSIVVPVGCAEKYKSAEGWSDYADIIVETA